MDIVIIGLPQCGKTAVFNALTHGEAELVGRGSGGTRVNIGVVKVPDPRLEALAALFEPKKVTPAEVRYIDLPASLRGFAKGSGPSGQYVAQAAQADALLHVVRAFDDPAVPHQEGGVDAARDIASMDLELCWADLALIEGRLGRLETSLKAAKAQEREAGQREREFWERVKGCLEQEVPLRAQTLSDEEGKTIANYPLLSGKPQLLLLNIGEEDISRRGELEAEFAARYGEQSRQVAALCGRLEMELSALEEEEAAAMRAAYGIEETGLERAIRLSYSLLGLATFFTFVSDEVRAWTVPAGASAPEAAGKIHSDIQRGFIRAEVASVEALVRCGSMAEARRQGLVRLEGRAYQVRDGDVITFFFNV